jgi:hypothetical protein
MRTAAQSHGPHAAVANAEGAADDKILFIQRRMVALVSPQRMMVRGFHDDDGNSIRILDPHLHQPPRLAPRLAENR